ncbi:MAG TPA: hypothetical protein VJP85_10770 [Candidatus Baltobacteraceae bacterium]|nr:hypothetical protein [Candidatus Baltobacteraceae bacterium]
MTIVPKRVSMNWSDRGRFLAELWTALFALLIAVRGKRWAASAPLSFILAFETIGDTLWHCVLPLPSLTLAVQAGAAITAPVASGLLVWYYGLFGRPLTRDRKIWIGFAYAAAALSAIAYIGHHILWGARLVAPQQLSLEFEIFEVLITSPVIPTTVCGVLAVRSAEPRDAQRVGWVVWSYGVLYLFWLFAGPLGPVWAGLNPALPAVIWQIENAAHLFVPIGLTYAALSRRLFDIGFVVNRAAVFAALSVLVVGCFVLLEWSIGKWFENVSHTTSLALNAVLALGLGLSLRFLHQRVDGVVDAVFFRKRNENERALRRFAHEAAFMTIQDVLLDRTVVEIEDHSEIASAEVRLAEDLPPNDPAVLALQAWREPIALAGYRSTLSGEYAFRMLAHADFMGAILCGEKKNGERYAPDEIETLKEVAYGVAVALRNLGLEGERRDVLLEILAKLNVIEGELSRSGASTPTAAARRQGA